ncbi:hypothetical protein FSP39_000426, partial [Pinctada imbricata]
RMTYKRRFNSRIVLFLLTCCSVIVYVFLVPNFKHVDELEHSDVEIPQFSQILSSKDVFTRSGNKRIVDVKTFPENDHKRVIDAAKHITRDNKTLLVSFINNAFLPFAYSWFCNTKPMGIHDQVLVIAADYETEQELRKNVPSIEVVSVTGYKVKGSQNFTHAGYVRLGIKRTEMVKWILNENIGIFIIEFDCLWVKNPIAKMKSYNNYDLTITQVIGREPGNVAIGFYYMSPSDRMKKLWNELDRRLKVLDAKLQKLPSGKKVHYEDNDQTYLHKLLDEKYGGVRMKIVSQYEFPDGKWYGFTKAEREKYRPYIINNNWLIGTDTKIQRAKTWGHWFLKSDGTCDEDQVKKIVEL